MSLIENIAKNLNKDDNETIKNNVIKVLTELQNHDYLNYSEKQFKNSVDYILNKLGGNIK